MTRRNSDQLTRSRDLKLAPPGKRPGLSSSTHTWMGTCSQSVGSRLGDTICWPGPWLVCLEFSPALLLLKRQGASDSSVIPCPPSPPMHSLHVGRPAYHTAHPVHSFWPSCPAWLVLSDVFKLRQSPHLGIEIMPRCPEVEPGETSPWQHLATWLGTVGIWQSWMNPGFLSCLACQAPWYPWPAMLWWENWELWAPSD